jgi:hypothetical protein
MAATRLTLDDDNIFIRTDRAGNVKPDKGKFTERITVRWRPSWLLTVRYAVAIIMSLQFMTKGDY